MIIFIICSCWLSIVAKCKRIKLSIALIEATWNVLGMGGIARTGHNATVIVQWCVGCVHGVSAAPAPASATGQLFHHCYLNR